MGEESRGITKPAIGIIGAIAAIASIWWFALRPRRDTGASSGDAAS